jgi:hypothetical protein
MKPTMRGRSWNFKLILLLASGVCPLLSGCGRSQTVWSTESRSPDGKVIANASTVVTGRSLSIVSNTMTDVQLKWAKGSRGKTSILELADATDDPVDTRVELNWLTPTHLELTVKGNQSIVFQAVKWDGIDISVRDLSKAAVENENKTRNLAPTPPAFTYKKTAPPSGH